MNCWTGGLGEYLHFYSLAETKLLRQGRQCGALLNCSASSIAGSFNANHCCMKWMRSMISDESGGRPRLPSGKYGDTKTARSGRGKTFSVSLRNSRRLVRLASAPVQRLFASWPVSSQCVKPLPIIAADDSCRSSLDKHNSPVTVKTVPN